MTYRQLLVKLQNLTDAQLNQEIKVRCSKSGVGAASTDNINSSTNAVLSGIVTAGTLSVSGNATVELLTRDLILQSGEIL